MISFLYPHLLARHIPLYVVPLTMPHFSSMWKSFRSKGLSWTSHLPNFSNHVCQTDAPERLSECLCPHNLIVGVNKTSNFVEVDNLISIIFCFSVIIFFLVSLFAPQQPLTQPLIFLVKVNIRGFRLCVWSTVRPECPAKTFIPPLYILSSPTNVQQSSLIYT